MYVDKLSIITSGCSVQYKPYRCRQICWCTGLAAEKVHLDPAFTQKSNKLSWCKYVVMPIFR